MESKRTQVERSAASRAAIVAAARTLYAERPFNEVGTSEVVATAGLTRGALYHQFGSKTELFAAVLEHVEQEVTDRVGHALVAGPQHDDALGLLLAGAAAWLDACAAPDVQRILLVDGPSVLGWERWRKIGQRYGLGLTAAALQAAVDAGALPPQPVEALAHVLVGALDEAALYIVRADDPVAARAEVDAVLQRLVRGLAAG